MATTDLDFEIILENQNDKEVVVNNNMIKLDKTLAATTDIDTAAGGTIAVTLLQFQENARLRLIGAPAGAFTLEIEEVKGFITISNQSGQDVTVQSTATPGDTVIVADGEDKLLYNTGSVGNHILNLSGASSSGTALYIVGGFFPGIPTNNKLLLQFVFDRSTEFPDDFSGSVGVVKTNPTSAVIIDIQKNGSSIGTINITTGGVVTFVTAGGGVEAFVSGDTIELVAQASADDTLADISITLSGIRI